MPQYRMAYLLVYRVTASGDGHAAQRVTTALGAAFPSVQFDGRGVQQSASQSVSGSTTYDVQLVASGVVTATDIPDALTKVAIPQTNLVSSVALAAVDQRAAGLF